jgi:hypothetical protein
MPALLPAPPELNLREIPISQGSEHLFLGADVAVQTHRPGAEFLRQSAYRQVIGAVALHQFVRCGDDRFQRQPRRAPAPWSHHRCLTATLLRTCTQICNAGRGIPADNPEVVATPE